MFSFANSNIKHNKLAKKRSKNRYKRTDMAKFNRRFHGNAGDGHLRTHHIRTPDVLPFHMTPSNLCCRGGGGERGVKRIQNFGYLAGRLLVDLTKEKNHNISDCGLCRGWP